MNARRYYHGNNQPDVHFMCGGKLYNALLEAFWESGVQLRLDASPQIALHQKLTGLHFSSGAHQTHAPDLQITDLRTRNHFLRLDAQVCNPENARELRQVLAGLANGSSPTNAAAVYKTTVPQFTRKKHYQPSAVAARVRWAEAVSNTRLKHLLNNNLKPETLAGNIENYIGTVQIPVGIAGPVHVRGVYTDDHIPLPIATTEGALISSITRGAQTCNAAGGIEAAVCRQTMVRAPVFFCRDLHGALNLERWIHDHLEAVRQKAESFSSVARLEQIRTHVFDNTVHAQFYYATGDASGQNMTSACTLMACRWIKQQVRWNPCIGLERFMIEGNLSGDKKANFQNFTLGRGIAVTATCRIPGPLLKKHLRVSARQFVRCYQAGEVGALHAGMMGSNINFANIIAGIFTATGQDIACVNESAAGYLKARQDGDDLVLAAYLPSLVIGTVGGGTKLPTQAECLALMGCAGSGKAFRLAEIIGAACLALDLSTGAAIVTNEFVHAHEHFGRNRPNKNLSWSRIDIKFFSDLLNDNQIIIESATRGDLDTRDAIISDVAQADSAGVCGLFRFHLRLRDKNGVTRLNTVLKIKPSGQQLVKIGAQVARLTGEDTLGGLFESQHPIFNLEHSNVREIALYQNAHKRLFSYLPQIYGTRCDKRRDIFAILMEDLSDCSHLNTVNDPSAWQPDHIRSVLEALGDIHTLYWNGARPLPKQVPIERLDLERYRAAEPLLRELTSFNAARYPNLMSKKLKQLLEMVLQDLPGFVQKLKQQPMTLTHNDFNPRNLCFRRANGSLQLVVYDWELALYQNPQHDLMEFLIFALDHDTPLSRFDQYAETYYQMLSHKIDDLPPANDFFQGLLLNAVDLALIRFNLYLMGHNILNFKFMERVYGNLSRYILYGWRKYGEK
jgi:hydroxymethylglutaryl-CoA reductase (NADPH)